MERDTEVLVHEPEVSDDDLTVLAGDVSFTLQMNACPHTAFPCI